MKFVRQLIGKLILFLDRTFSPVPMERPALEQRKIDEQTSSYSLYQFETCPFCVKVRRHMKRLNLKIPLINVLKDQAAEQELITAGGKRQVPCLKIKKSDGTSQWMYESTDIINHLNNQFGASK